MLLGILGDTHGKVHTARTGLKILQQAGAECYFHTGDVGHGVLDLLAGLKCWFVFGNNDFDRASMRAESKITGVVCLDTFGIVELAGKKIAMTHGDEPHLIRRATTDDSIDYLFTGHTHVRNDERVGKKLRWINPGALHRAPVKTVVTLDTETDLLRVLDVPE
jgi:uncharacterized protein